MTLLAAQHIPCVLVDRDIPGLRVNGVVSDNFQGSKDVTKALIDKGHQRILVMAGIACTSIHRRLQGHVEALQEAGIASDPDLIIKADDLLLPVRHPRHAQEPERIRKRIEQAGDFTACYALNPTLLQAAIQILAPEGREAGTPIAIATYDQAVRETVRVSNSATVVKQPSYRMGWEAARLLIETLNHPALPVTQMILQPEIIEESL